jgi:ribosomal protein S18 acetylase RimI-like enzyme
VTIRSARPEDASAVLALWARARSAHATTPDDPAALQARWARDPDALLVAERDGEMIGTVVAGWDGWRGNLYRVAVHPGARRRGVALALVRAAEDRLRARGARRVGAAVGHGDPVAAALWTAAGCASDDDRWARDL